MKNPLISPFATNLGLFLARLPLGAYFALAGFGKIFHVGVGKFAASQLSTATKIMPEPLGNAYLHLLPFVELLVGSLTILGFFARTTGLVMSLMLISFVIGATGVQFSTSGGAPFHANLVFLGISMLMLLTGPGKIACDNLTRRKSS